LSDFGLSKVLDKNIYATIFSDGKEISNSPDKDAFYSPDPKNQSSQKGLQQMSKIRRRRVVS